MMIRGAIEVAQKNRVAGWIYSSADSVRDKLILAFVGGRCVGSGKVDRFRKDLLEAKLGDGYCGFEFPIKLNEGEKLGAVVVKLQSSDAALIQRDSVLTGPHDEDEAADLPDLGAISPASVAWMQDRGWLEQHEYDFLKAVTEFRRLRARLARTAAGRRRCAGAHQAGGGRPRNARHVLPWRGGDQPGPGAQRFRPGGGEFAAAWRGRQRYRTVEQRTRAHQPRRTVARTPEDGTRKSAA
ncbi:MAG: hypothetical protein WDN04_21760 [Rhodospirillales bacterium]